MKFCYNTNFTLPKQFQRSRSVLQDRPRSLGLFWKKKLRLITEEIWFAGLIRTVSLFCNLNVTNKGYSLLTVFSSCFAFLFKLRSLALSLLAPTGVKYPIVTGLTMDDPAFLSGSLLLAYLSFSCTFCVHIVGFPDGQFVFFNF